MSSSSAIIIEAEVCRQRYKRLHPKDLPDDEKDYKTLVHTLTPERLQEIFKSKFGTDGGKLSSATAPCQGIQAFDCHLSRTAVYHSGKCRQGPCGLKEEQANVYFEVYGKNAITPPQRENIWIKLLKQTFLGIFNILLWSCVVAEVALIVAFSGKTTASEMPKINATAFGTILEDKDEVKDEAQADYVTPIILSAVIVMVGLLEQL
ncbi:unnamed protein product [Polarella glacialis]|uniref:Cation-transporting P-type ATPase N-terminal domain-containing protein n=1 Tax=Polarella glacialis TaxID=89957 RepID=A0A813JT95_POLGL|nr:unnamed protein product [Polarella glacialis]